MCDNTINTLIVLFFRQTWNRVKELSQLVTGIRIFNKTRGVPSEGVPPLTDLLQQAISATVTTLNTVYTKTDQRRLLLERAIFLAERSNDSLVAGEVS